MAVECKLPEADFGTCSRTRLRPRDNNYASDFCDGTYTRQRGRQSNCALTQSNIHYWDYLDELLGWRPDIEHWPCRLSATYQLVRNILAVCVVANGEFRADAGHALTIYDERNPAMAADGRGMQQWDAVHEAHKQAPLLRRLSWQSLISQLPGDPVLDWLKEKLTLKYGLSASRYPQRRTGLCFEFLERAKGFEPSTPTLARLCSTPELRPHPKTGQSR